MMNAVHRAPGALPGAARGESASPPRERADGSTSSPRCEAGGGAEADRVEPRPPTPGAWSSLPEPLVSRLPTSALLAARLVSRRWRADIEESAPSLYGLALSHQDRAPRSWSKALAEKMAFGKEFLPLVSRAAPPEVRAKLRADASEVSLTQASVFIARWKFDEAILALHQVDLSTRSAEAKALYEQALRNRPLEREIIARSPASALPAVLQTLAVISRRGPEPLLDLAERSGVSLSEPRKYDCWALSRTPFDQAVCGGDAPLALALLDRLGRRDLERPFAGLRPLARAAKLGNVALARGLLERGAAPASPTETGATALDLAIAGGHHATAMAILEGHRARRSAPQDLARLLYAVGAHRPLALGLLALDRDFGAREGGLEIGGLLRDWIERDRAEPGRDPVSPKLFDVASTVVRQDLARDLSATWRDASEIVSLIPALAQVQFDGTTLLPSLVTFDPGLFEREARIVPETMRALLDAGADPNAENEHGETPLLAMDSDPAAARDMVSLLFEKGANLNARCTRSGENVERRLLRLASEPEPRRAEFARLALEALRACQREALSIDAWFPFG